MTVGELIAFHEQHKGCNAPELLAALEAVREDVCGALCPSTWRTGEPQPHGEKCRAISAAIAKDAA